MSDTEITAAKLRAEGARKRLALALAALKDRLLPRTIARNLASGIADKSAEIAKSSADAAKARPAVAIGVAALAALFFARKPIIRAISTDDEATEPVATRSKPASD